MGDEAVLLTQWLVLRQSPLWWSRRSESESDRLRESKDQYSVAERIQSWDGAGQTKSESDGAEQHKLPQGPARINPAQSQTYLTTELSSARSRLGRNRVDRVQVGAIEQKALDLAKD